jgi:hypothetical protein
MEVNEQELEWMYWGLIAQRAYRDTPDIPHGVVLWEPWKEELLKKVNHERSKLDSSLEEES